MKLKISLDPNTIKQFCLDHVEKVLFGMVVILFSLFVYKAVARPVLDWQPEDLVQDAAKADKNIESTQPSPIAIKSYTAEADRIRKPISEADYTFKAAWDPPRLPENRRRGVPDLFAVKDLRASGGNGQFAMAAPEEIEDEAEGPMSTLRGQRWVVLTGLIQHLKQKQAYDSTYRGAVNWDYQRDYPDYIFYRVERAEVDPRIETAELQWRPLHVMNMLSLQDLWLQPGTDLVDPVYLPPVRGSVSLAYPLGPLQGRTWGPEVAHAKEIPILEPGALAMAGMGMPGMPGSYPGATGKRSKSSAGGKDEPESEEEIAKAAAAAKKAAAERRKKARERLARQPDEPDVFATAGGPGAMGPGSMSPESGMPYSGVRRPMRPSRMSSMPGSMPGEVVSGSGSMMPGMSPRRRLAAEDEEEEVVEEQEVEYLLFRFFDFSVKPGKYYRYRVKLVLANPNFGMPPQFLEQDAMSKIRTLETEWSDVSPAAPVPSDSQVLAVSGRGGTGEAGLMLVRFLESDGTMATEELTVSRGQWLDYRNRTFKPPAQAGPGMGMPMGGSMDPMGSMSSMPGMGPMPGMGMAAAPARELRVDYLTDSLLLDVNGGGRLPGKDRSLTEPGNILLLNREGKLVVRNELDDLADYEFYKPPEVKQPVMTGYPGYPGGSPDMPYGMPGEVPAKGKGRAKAKGSMSSMPPGMMPGSPSMPPAGSPGSNYLDDRSKKKKR